jgi:TatD DNase family protein
MAIPGASTGSLAGQQRILSFAIKDKAALYASFMPFVKNGGLFIPTTKRYQLGDEIFLLLQLMEETERIPVAGKVVWVTPPGAEGSRASGSACSSATRTRAWPAARSRTISSAPSTPIARPTPCRRGQGRGSRAEGLVDSIATSIRQENVRRFPLSPRSGGLRPYGGDFARLMQATAEAGVTHMLCVSIDLEHYPEMRRLVDPWPEQVAVSVGVHPNQEDGRPEPTVETLVSLAADPRNVAIGETGLDYFHRDLDPAGSASVSRPHRRRTRLRQAADYPHRDAREDTIAILREEGADAVGGVLHCFTENWEMAKAGLDLGFYVSFSGIVTFKNAEELREVARRVPLDRLLIETDSPYLAPCPIAASPTSPRWSPMSRACIAELRGIGAVRHIPRSLRQCPQVFHAVPPRFLCLLKGPPRAP